MMRGDAMGHGVEIGECEGVRRKYGSIEHRNERDNGRETTVRGRQSKAEEIHNKTARGRCVSKARAKNFLSGCRRALRRLTGHR